MLGRHKEDSKNKRKHFGEAYDLLSLVGDPVDRQEPVAWRVRNDGRLSLHANDMLDAFCRSLRSAASKSKYPMFPPEAFRAS